MVKKEELLECLKNITISGLPLILPPVGAALLTLANECFNSSAKARQDKWNEEIVKKFTLLDGHFEQKIRETSNFASILASAQRGALEDIEEDKVALYVNAVINSIKNEKINDTKKHIFLNILRDCTLLHIEVLKEILKSKGPKLLPTYGGFSIENPLLLDLRMKFEDHELLEAVLKNLSEYHLTYTSLNKMGQMQPTTITDLGKEFLAFIEEIKQ